MVKSVITLLASLVVVAGLLSGCGNQNPNNNVPPNYYPGATGYGTYGATYPGAYPTTGYGGYGYGYPQTGYGAYGYGGYGYGYPQTGYGAYGYPYGILHQQGQ